MLQCGGTYVPLLESTAGGGDERAVVAHVTPTNAEGLGFLELVADALSAESPATRNDVSPLVSTAVFLTPDPKLAAELARARTGARAEHAPVLFNIGAAITGRASGAAVGAAVGAADRSESAIRESAEVREEIVFHAARAPPPPWAGARRRAASSTRSTPTPGVPRAGVPPEDCAGTRTRCRRAGHCHGRLLRGGLFRNRRNRRARSRRAGARLVRAPPKLGTRAGAATLLRAACSSGDVATVRLVIAWVIRSFSAVVVSDLLATGDAIGIGGDWTPLHAAADAVASATAKAPRRGAAAARAAVQALEASADPLSWVAVGPGPGAARASPSAILRRGGSGLERATRSKALGKQLAAMDEKVLDELASAVASAVAHLRDASGGWPGAFRAPRGGARALRRRRDGRRAAVRRLVRARHGRRVAFPGVSPRVGRARARAGHRAGRREPRRSQDVAAGRRVARRVPAADARRGVRGRLRRESRRGARAFGIGRSCAPRALLVQEHTNVESRAPGRAPSGGARRARRRRRRRRDGKMEKRRRASRARSPPRSSPNAPFSVSRRLLKKLEKSIPASLAASPRSGSRSRSSPPRSRPRRRSGLKRRSSPPRRSRRTGTRRRLRRDPRRARARRRRRRSRRLRRRRRRGGACRWSRGRTSTR